MVNKWDIEIDVIVVGYGLAGAISAIAAHDAGAKVIIMEKMPVAGGNSLLAGGSCIWSSDKDAAAKYLGACSGGRVSPELIDYMAHGMTEFPALLDRLSKEANAVTAIIDTPYLFYNFPGRESFKVIRVTGFRGEEDERIATQVMDQRRRQESSKRGGYTLMQMLFRNIEKRHIKVMLNTPVKRLTTDGSGRVTGLQAESQGKEIVVKTNRAVILACGGFVFNDWLLKQYCEIQPIYGIGCKGNTGDGVLMSQKVGAALWHMWLLHGAYGFKFPEFDYAFRVPFGGALNPEDPTAVPWILVNKYGRRFMNEAIPFMQDASYRGMQTMNCDFLSTPSKIPEYSNIPCYMILDEEGRRAGPIAFPLTVMEEEMYYWSRNNIAEIERGWIKRADTLSELAGIFDIDVVEIKKTVQRWNSQCLEQKDADFGRIAGSMLPITTPPFYGVTCWPIVTNTQGGPQFNTRCQIVDPYGEPIPRLYKAGELGSFFGHLYTLGGNLSECIIEGRTAGENAAGESSL